MNVRWLRTALQNLEDIADHIAEDNPPAADEMVTRIFAAVEVLAEFPNLGRPGRVSGTRELVVAGTPYLIPYRVRDDNVEILRVFHGSRQWPREF